MNHQWLADRESSIPALVRTPLRGIGQVFFQESALSGACFLVGILVSAPIMALGAAAGSVIGSLSARLLKFDQAELSGGIYGFNSALVGIATLFFFQPGAASVSLLVVGSVLAAVVTRALRRFVPFPTYTTPFVVLTWVVYLIGPILGATRVAAGEAPDASSLFAAKAVAHGVSQVMFQATLATGALFLIGIAVSNWRHALWVLAGSIVGMLMASHHTTEAVRALDPERLVDRTLFENIALGLYGYNATLAAVALYLWRKSLIPPLLGMILSVPITELIPRLGVPALTAPFVLATWLVLALGWLDVRLTRHDAPPVA